MRADWRGWLPDGAEHAGGREYLLRCPQPDCASHLKNKKKFAWNTDKECGHCLTCGFSIGGMRKLRLYFGDHGELASQRVVFRSPAVPSSYTPVGSDDYLAGTPAALYLRSRGVDAGLAEEIPVLDADGRIWFPLWSPFGLTQFLLGRIARKTEPGEVPWMSFPAFKSKYLFGELPTGPTLIVVESIFDVLTPGWWGQAVSILGSEPSVDMIAWLAQRYPQWVIALNNYNTDQAGRKGADLIQGILKGWFPEHKICVAIPPGQKNDFGQCTPEEAHYAATNAVKAAGWW